ncbi:cache domain-containing protein [Yaniella halotolerans]|uniref:cache domain-containing protein n=1 Tax=Yaniella halotolerans TaxID=225453 RepID=UPI0003B71FD6|nr:cache domain-containing protein [Yaniella halotolerans]
MEFAHTTTEITQRLSDWTENIFDGVTQVRTKFVNVVEQHVEKSPKFYVSSAERKMLHEVAAEHLAARPATDGVGLIFQRELVHASSPALEWWIRFGDHCRWQEFDNDPSSPRFYDYEQLEWFRGGFGAEARTIAGPYIDYLGVDEYITTWVIPLVVNHKTVGVVGADLKVDTLEKCLIPILQKAPNGRAALVNEGGRVIVSTIGPYGSGALLETAPPGYTLQPLCVADMDLQLLFEKS